MCVGVQSVQAGTLAAAHTARESVVKILPPPAVDRPMVWSRGSARARLPASRGRVVIGLERVRDVRRLHAPLHVVSELPGLRAVEVAGPSAALRTLLASPPHWIRYAEPLDRLAVLGSPNDPLLSVVD